MILCPIAQFHRYRQLHPLFQAVGAFLAELDLRSVVEGRMDLQGDDLYVLASPRASTRPVSKAPLEAHRTYIDVQVILAGTETMGWSPLEACRTEAIPYDASKDIVFFADPPMNLFTLPAGHLAVFFPEDAHAPLIGGGHSVKKLVVKVRI